MSEYSRMLCVTILVLLTGIVGCDNGKPISGYVARLGNRVYTQEDLNRALASLPATGDTTEAREQILQQWITTELLYREAVRRGLKTDTDVVRLLEENERSVLVSALLSNLYDDEQPIPNETEILGYYEQHRDQLKLREPFVKIYYLATAVRDSAIAAISLLSRLNLENAVDKEWKSIAVRYAIDPEASFLLSDSYYPESRILSLTPQVQLALRALGPGQTMPVVEEDGFFQVLRLVDRLRPGTLPELPLIRGQIIETLAIENRKQLYARQVQRLRNEALAREELELQQTAR